MRLGKVARSQLLVVRRSMVFKIKKKQLYAENDHLQTHKTDRRANNIVYLKKCIVQERGDVFDLYF